MKNIYIIGTGAIGKVLAVCLKANNRNVVLLRGSVDGQLAYHENISVALSDREAIEANVKISTVSNFEKLDGTIVLTNKSYGNAKLAAILKGKFNDSPVVLLQNGLGVEQAFIDAGFPAVYRCVLFATSQPIDGYHFNFRSVAVSPIGMVKGGDKLQLNHIVELLDTQMFKFRTENNIQPLIWKKAIINSVFNSICPLLEVDNGIFQKSEHALNIAKIVIGECLPVAERQGVFLNKQEVIESLLRISKASEGQFISTLQDIRNNRQTEIETLNSAIVEISEAMGNNSLLSWTKLLGELTLLKSSLSSEKHNN